MRKAHASQHSEIHMKKAQGSKDFSSSSSSGSDDSSTSSSDESSDETSAAIGEELQPAEHWNKVYRLRLTPKNLKSFEDFCDAVTTDYIFWYHFKSPSPYPTTWDEKRKAYVFS